jgi:hypothetical protein
MFTRIDDLMNSVTARAKIFYPIEHQKDKNANIFYDDFLFLLEKYYSFRAP